LVDDALLILTSFPKVSGASRDKKRR